jgi:hypothetical protein
MQSSLLSAKTPGYPRTGSGRVLRLGITDADGLV